MFSSKTLLISPSSRLQAQNKRLISKANFPLDKVTCTLRDFTFMKTTNLRVGRALILATLFASCFAAHAQTTAPAPGVAAVADAVQPIVPATPFPTLLALDNNGVWALHVAEGRLKIKGDVAIDSSNRSALWMANGSLQLSEGALNVAGGYTHLGTNTVSPSPRLGGAAVADPLPQFRIPSDLDLVSREKLFLQTDANGDDTVLSPGIYNGGIFASGSGHITLEPGVYVLNNGDFNAIGPTVEGENVTIVMAGDGAGALSFSLGAKLIASAPRDGQLKDLVIVSRAVGGLTKAVSFAVSGARLDGIVYAPGTQFNLSSGADVRASKVICLSCSVVSSQLELTGERQNNAAADAATATENNQNAVRNGGE